MSVSFSFKTHLPLPATGQELQDRIKHLFAIREALDQEIETLMGVKAETAKLYHCVRCDYKWKSRLAHRPKMCPSCRVKRFDRPPLYTYEEKIARKKEQKELVYLREKGKRVPVDTPLEELPPINPMAPMPHSVLTRQISTESDSIQNVALTPPPAPDRPLSLRERLEWMKTQPPPVVVVESEPVIEQTEEDLMASINGESDAT
jgi:DNA-directed RNA polymerase subunit RPC12/RpoP